MAKISSLFGRPSALMLLAGAAVLGFLVIKNYSSPGTPPAEKAIANDVKKRKHGKGKKGARDPIKTEAGAWVYGNVANDDITAGEGWNVTGAMNNRALQWQYGKPTPMGMYPADDYGILEGVIPYVGMDLSGGDAINEVVKQKSPKAMYARMIRGGY